MTASNAREKEASSNRAIATDSSSIGSRSRPQTSTEPQGAKPGDRFNFLQFMGLLILGLGLCAAFGALVYFWQDVPILVVSLSGALGGLIYCALRDDRLYRLRFERDSVDLGLLLDLLVGMAGAYVVFLVLPEDLLGEQLKATLKGNPEVAPSPLDGIKFAAIALAGGYGGRTLIDQILGEFVKEIQVLQTRVNTLDSSNSLTSLVNTQLGRGLPDDEQAALKNDLKATDEEQRKKIYARAIEATRNKATVGNTILIFEALIEVEPSNHRYYGGLGYAYKDKTTPDWQSAETNFKKAIQLRGTGEFYKEFLGYEVNLVICTIKSSQDDPDAVVPDIQRDLTFVQQNGNLENILEEVTENARNRKVLSGWFKQYGSQLPDDLQRDIRAGLDLDSSSATQ